ncbi:hypothetical protein HK100_012095 [Physocladia obscura]|uniref:Uncharacterized protein n=1 Tax=Physocladia obscura TaxID=109957 RepID=A0AAD5T9A9_9FUNG|nr:hypothetical protein HK100_012095 [Physocladia obscura]
MPEDSPRTASITSNSPSIAENTKSSHTKVSKTKRPVSKHSEDGRQPPRKNLQLGVMVRTPMGEYIAQKGEPQLSSLANPTPGPLTYDPKLPPSGFQYSILGKHVATKMEETPIGPGPNKYNVRSTTAVFNDAPHWSLGKKLGEFMKVENKNPSPFAYENTVKGFGKEGPRYTISGWSEVPTDATPSPDKYNPTVSSIPVSGANPKFSFGLKTNSGNEISPGPQDYDGQFIKSSVAPTAPSYTIRPRVGEPVFTSKESSQIPAANEYNPKLSATAKAASLKGWYKEPKSLKTPGPANYIIPNQLFSGPQYSLTGRPISADGDDDDDEFVVADVPGPTSYDPRPMFEASPKNSLGGRWKHYPSRNLIPGPGAYEPKDRQIRGNGAPKVTLKGRYETKISSNPGPADYNTASSTERIITLAELSRLEKKDVKVPPRIRTIIEKFPGPADYNLKSIEKVKPSGPKYSLGTRLVAVKGDQTPGPNSYTASKPLDGPRVTMKSRSSPFVLVFPSQRVDTLRLGN